MRWSALAAASRSADPCSGMGKVYKSQSFDDVQLCADMRKVGVWELCPRPHLFSLKADMFEPMITAHQSAADLPILPG